MQIGLQGLARHFSFHSTVSVSFREHGIPRWNSKRKLSNILGPFSGSRKGDVPCPEAMAAGNGMPEWPEHKIQAFP